MLSCDVARTLVSRVSFGEYTVSSSYLVAACLPFICRDPRFIREFKAAHCVEVFAEHVTTKKKCVSLSSDALVSEELMPKFARTGGSCGGGRTSRSWSIRTRSDHPWSESVALNLPPSHLSIVSSPTPIPAAHIIARHNCNGTYSPSSGFLPAQEVTFFSQPPSWERKHISTCQSTQSTAHLV